MSGRIRHPRQLRILQPPRGDAPLTLAAGGLVHHWGEGAWHLQPRRPAGPDHLVLSAGVHGNETAPIEILEHLFRRLCCGGLEVRNRTLLLIGNPAAVRAGKRFVGENLNRLFGPGARRNGMEPRRAAQLRAWVRRFFRRRPARDGRRVHYDMHSAIRTSHHERFLICPHGGAASAQQLAFWRHCGVDAALFANAPASTFSHFCSASFAAEAFTVELGRVRPLGDNDMDSYAPLGDMLAGWIAGRRPAPPPLANGSAMHLYGVVRTLVRDGADYRLNLDTDVPNFTALAAGFAVDSNFCIERDGDAIVFPNAQVPVGQRTGLIVRRTDNSSEVL